MLTLFLFFTASNMAFAVEDPLSVPNNKIGIHILFPSELKDAANLINANGGDWGYVTIPIQAGDKDLVKWQKFMDDAVLLHVIPIIRLATEGDYFNTKVWRKPNDADIIDFANFLNSLSWPTKNRYIVVFNEVNRGDEWGGIPNPSEYAELLSYAFVVFKSRSQDFFIISSGMDNAAGNSGVSINQYDYLRAMEEAVPGIFRQIDGIASHSYPNPAFAQPPSVHTRISITSFLYEKALIESFSQKSLPVFITETGWSKAAVSSEELLASYYTTAFESVWNDNSIVAITPFLLRANTPPFNVFSFIREDGSFTHYYNALKNMNKIKGQPAYGEQVLAQSKINTSLPVKNFSNRQGFFESTTLPPGLKMLGKWLLKLE